MITDKGNSFHSRVTISRSLFMPCKGQVQTSSVMAATFVKFTLPFVFQFVVLVCATSAVPLHERPGRVCV